MKKNLLAVIIICCYSIVSAQTNYLDNYIGNPVTLTTIGNSSNQILQPRDLDFKPNTNECWVANYGNANGGSNVIFYNAGLPNQTSQYRKDSHTGHFMRFPSAIAFGDNGMWACVSEILNTNSGTFMGPGLWLADTNVFARVFQNNWVNGFPLGSHLDMLHQSPFAMGIAHDSLTSYWVMDGHFGNICKYDFAADHGPGYDNHSDGKIWRYTDVPVTRVAGVPSHMVLDKTNHWLYFIDGVSKTIKRMNTLSGSHTGNLTAPNESLALYWQMTGATVEVLTTLATQPCGIDYYNGRLVVSDYTNGNIYLYSTAPSFTLLATIATGHQGMMGVKVGPDGHIWCVNYPENILYRLDATLPAADVAIQSITSPVVENVTANFLSCFFSPGFNVCNGSITPSATIANNGSSTVNTVDLQYTVDGGSPVSFTWNGTLAPAATASVALPSSAVTIGSHMLTVSILNVNGSPDEVDLNNDMTGAFRSFNPPSTLPFSEGFAAVTFPPAGWSYLHYNTICKMTRNAVGGFGLSTGSMKMDNWSGSVDITGQKDYLMFPVIDFTSGTANTYLKFSVAHAQYNSTADALQVQVSTNCGASWSTVYNKSGAALSTVSGLTSVFTPSATQWRADSVSMAAYAGQPEVMLMFTTISNYGNNIYIDDVYISGSPTAISEPVAVSAFTFYPNPATSELSISDSGVRIERIEIYNTLGEKVFLQASGIKPQNTIDVSRFTPGIYFLSVTQNQIVTTKKLVIQ